MKNCPFCGQKIFPDANVCKHCGKTLKGGGTSESSVANLDTWKEKSIPSWAMYLLCGAALGCVWIMFAQGCEKVASNQRERDSEESARQQAMEIYKNTVANAKKPLLIVNQVVEVACAYCQFEMDGIESCELAIRHEGKTYLVADRTIDDFGDPHAPNGLCNCIRKVKVSGQVLAGEFVASDFNILPIENDAE